MSHSNANRNLLLLLSLLLCFTLFAAPAAAAGKKTYENGALTPPPPIQDSYARYVPSGGKTGTSGGGVTPNSDWDPDQIYLSSGDVGISDSDGVITFDGTTYASQIVDKVGIQLTVQRWTGSSWTNVYTTKNKTDTFTATAYYSESRAVTKGYYYRISGYHWVSNEGITESGISYGSYRLVQ